MNFPKELSEFMEKYDISRDEIWQPRANGAWVVKHKAIERAAASAGIKQREFRILAIDLERKIAAVEVLAELNGRSVRTTGEAAPYNNKNGYPVAMAEKRAWDRANLKLLQVHGDIYSESEADEFVDPSGAKDGKLLRSSQYARTEYKKLVDAIDNCASLDMLDEFNVAYKEQIRATPYTEELLKEWEQRRDTLSEQER